jgi:two-component system, sensor histidine kinase ChiS
MPRIYNLIIAFLLTTGCAIAQPADYIFDHLGIDQGLSNLTVTSIFQDSKGFMWFGTLNGLNRYDGYQIKTYFNDPRDSTSVSDNRITVVFEDNHKNLWVGTNVGGLNLYLRDQDKFQRFTKESPIKKFSISSNRIETIFQDSQGNLWVGTNDGLNIYNYDNGCFNALYKKDGDPSSLNSNQIYSIIENNEQDLIILTNEKDLNKYNHQQKGFSHFTFEDGPDISFNTARVLYHDRENNTWIGTLDNGLIRQSKSGLKQYRHVNGDRSISHNLIRTILQDDKGTIWIGTDGGGLNLYNPLTDDFTRIRADEENKTGLSSNAIYSLYQDRAGTIWIGTFGGGIDIYNRFKEKFIHYTSQPNKSNSLSNKSVLALLEDSKGIIWIGTDGGGLNMFDRKTNTFKSFRYQAKDRSSISADVVKSLHEDKNGNLWVGTYLGGLNKFDRSKNKFQRIVHEAGSSVMNIIWDIYEDSRGNLWLSTLGHGLMLYNPEKNSFHHFQPFAGEGALSDYNVISMLEDSEGNLWIGTEDHGIDLFHYETGKFTYLHNIPEDSSSLNSDHAWVIFEDSKNQIWIGTAGGGLNLYNREKKNFHHYTMRDGLPSNIISGILEDKDGNLWITTGKGLSKFNPQKKTFKNFDVRDGLQSNDFNINAVCESRSGELYIGGVNGFNIFNPSRLRDNPYVPPVTLTDFQVFNRPVKVGGPDPILEKQITETDVINLTYRESVISFRFAALNYISPEKNQYAYRMEGFENEWNYVGTKREVTYTNLDPGTYTFRVIASNNDGVWNAEGTVITVIITPPWWETMWFKTLLFVFIITGIVLIYKVRTYSIRKTMRLEKERELRVKEAEIREERLKHEKHVVELSKSKLESEVHFKNSELATSVMNVVKQNETLLKIKEDIASTLKTDTPENQLKNLKRIIKLIDLEVKPDQNWNQFEQLFNQIHENFLQRLKERYPELTNRDLKLCAYLRMNLNSKEIAPLLSLSVRGVEDLRYRVRKKMNLDTEMNLSEFILKL